MRILFARSKFPRMHSVGGYSSKVLEFWFQKIIPNTAMVPVIGECLECLLESVTVDKQSFKREMVKCKVKMCCFGLGVSRIFQAIIEREGGNTKEGIVWPKKIAPYSWVFFASPNLKNDANKEEEEMFSFLSNEVKDVLYDDRKNVSFGVKIAESKLLGIQNLIILRDDLTIEVENQQKQKFFFKNKSDDAFRNYLLHTMSIK